MDSLAHLFSQLIHVNLLFPLLQPDTCGKLWNARDGNTGKAGLFNIELLKVIDIVHITASELLTEL